MHMDFELPLSRTLWQSRYRYAGPQGSEQDIEATWQRVAQALASAEPTDRTTWQARFMDNLRDFRFLPGGRILAGAGTSRQVTLLNCFVMGIVEDSLEGIFDALKEGALTMQQGGGVGYDFSTLRPCGAAARTHAAVASGPVSFLRIWDSMCATLLSTGNRRGAMMATLRCDHPDIEAFIDAKRDPHELRNFNLSVLVTDAFMRAVADDADWPLVFPAAAIDAPGTEQVMRRWPGCSTDTPCRVLRHVRARALWNRLVQASYDCAEPGVLFIDRINEENNLRYRERISATNPCGEIPLPPYGACDLGSINLTRFVSEPFGERATIQWKALEQSAATAVRMLDNVLDLSRYPLPAQSAQAQGSRRIGLGITGLADALIMLGLHYASEAARTASAQIMRRIRDSAYRASVGLARERGAFPFFESTPFLSSGFARRLPADIRADIARYGIRNSHLLAIAPTGTVSLLADNLSNGLEPVYAFEAERRIRQPDGNWLTSPVSDYAWRRYRATHPNGPLPDYFIDALSLSPAAHLKMQAALQPFVDNAISKTINVPKNYALGAYAELFLQAHRLGLKGCTGFRPNPVTGAVLSPAPTGHCCSPER